MTVKTKSAKKPSRYTSWMPLTLKPVRHGEYEGREKGTGARLVVHWKKKSEDLPEGFYFDSGVWGHFHMWQSAEGKMDAWRGLTEDPRKDPRHRTAFDVTPAGACRSKGAL